MKSNKLKEIDIKNHTCYYFDDIIEIKDFDFDFDNILIDEKSYKNNLVYDISYKTLFGSKPLHTRVDQTLKLLGFMMGIDIYYYLVLKIIMPFTKVKKSGITYIIFHNFAKIKIDSYDSLP